MKNRFFKWAVIAIQIVFWLVAFYFFFNNSYFRPYTYYHPYKEVVVFVGIMALCYFISRFLMSKYCYSQYFGKFVLISLCAIVCVALLEFLFVCKDVELFLPSVPQNLKMRYLVSIAFLIAVRDFCFVSFIFIVEIFQYFHNKYAQLKEQNRELYDQYIIDVNSKESVFVKISDMLYVSHKRNYSFFYLTNDRSYSQYVSLSAVEASLPSHLFVRVSKNVIVMMAHVKSCDGKYVVIDVEDSAGEEKIIPISKNYKASVMETWTLYRQRNVRPENVEHLDTDVYDAENLAKICEFVRVHPLSKTQDIADAANLSLRTCQRYLRTLRDSGRVVYMGSRGEKSGYRTVEKKGYKQYIE